ncbi:hypothetical protein [Mucilaginibacter rubeus]|uniref:hypothetical protein n=1 Tax=Mucilaginibacter rubeus TaxID=2027860 RepID=UPI00167FEC14|nr:hypothetical protein [Mucilaginibacter rubeus]
MKTLSTVKRNLISVFKYLFIPHKTLSPGERAACIKGELISIYLITIRLYYVIYN